MSAIRIGAGLLLLLLGLQGCGRTPAKAKSADVVALPFHDTAMFLAGLQGRPDGPFRAAEETPAWRRYAAQFSQTWAEAEQSQFRPVDAFSQGEINPIHTGSSFVFYPFSGPDVLYVTHFFPQRKIYVLAGLERVGSIRPPSEYTVDLDKQMNNWSQALESIFHRSFFVTREMDSQFHGRVADGLLPMILLLLARSGDVIEGVEYGHLEDRGGWIPDEANPDVRHMAVAIRFHAGDGTSRKLYYFSTRLGPEFTSDPAFDRFLRGLGRPDTLVKSASFLLHWKMCSALRDYILENSNLILEDDTGVLYSDLQPANWKISLFGEYSRPDRPFRKEYQKDLAEAFSDPGRVRPLGFSLGYGYHRRPSSLILAVRSRK